MWRRFLFAFIYVAVTIVMWRMYDLTSDHSLRAIADWTMLYAWGVVLPGLWTRRSYQTYRELNLPITSQLQLLAWAPVMVAGLLLITTLRMLERAQGV